MGIAVQSLLNNALADDTLDEGYVSRPAQSLLSDMLSSNADIKHLNLHRIRDSRPVPL